MTEERSDLEDVDAAQGGGPPCAYPWTLVVEEEGWSADLEHGAPLPCVDDRIDFIAEDGAERAFRVTRVVHTLQRAASERPPVHDAKSTPNAIVTDGGDGRRPGALRAGLPRVFVVADDRA
jgi:hypothetical protein